MMNCVGNLILLYSDFFSFGLFVFLPLLSPCPILLSTITD